MQPFKAIIRYIDRKLYYSEMVSRGCINLRCIGLTQRDTLIFLRVARRIAEQTNTDYENMTLAVLAVSNAWGAIGKSVCPPESSKMRLWTADLLREFYYDKPVADDIALRGRERWVTIVESVWAEVMEKEKVLL